MMNPKHDYLWNPKASADPEVAALEAQLRSFGASALGLSERPLPVRSTSLHRHRWWLGVAASMAMLAIGAALLVRYRLEWPSSEAWRATIAATSGETRNARLEVGEALVTQANETVMLDAARIGVVTVAPESAISLLETRTGRHRLQLQYGRLHAKVWAPPGHFGVNSGDGIAVDLGCEFEIVKDKTGRGALTVASGWVMYVRGASETLVPENYAIAFDDELISTPVRINADPSLRESAQLLDALLRLPTPDTVQVARLTAAIASSATQSDTFTLLSLLSRHPELAGTVLYDRLGSALDAPLDEIHRARWLRNETAAKNEWWNRLPQQPKRWWLHWRDAL